MKGEKRNHQTTKKAVMFSCLVVKGKWWTHVVGCQFSLALVCGPQVFPAILRIPTSPWVGSQMPERIWGMYDLSLVYTKRSAVAFYFHY